MTELNDKLNRIFEALADPARRVILEQLGSDELSTRELARPLGLNMPTITLHLSMLENAGLITRSGYERWRLYRLEPEPSPNVVSDFDHVLRELHEKEVDAHTPAERLTLT